MDAFELLKETREMCEAQTNCGSCGLHGNCFFTHRPRYISDAMIKKLYSEVEKWSEAHQPITNAMKFKEVFGFMPAGCQTFYFVEPNGSYSKTIDWQAPYKEPEHEAM